MSRIRARNDRLWSKKSKTEICSNKGWIFQHIIESPAGAGWYADNPFFFQLKNNGRWYDVRFKFNRQASLSWHHSYIFYGHAFKGVPDPFGPFDTQEDAVLWIYRVWEYYKGYPEHQRRHITTARHSETRRILRKSEKSGERWAAKRQIKHDITEMET